MQEILSVPDSPIPLNGDTLLRDADVWIRNNWGGSFDGIPPQMRITCYLVHAKPGWLDAGTRKAAEAVMNAQAELSGKRNTKMAHMAKFMMEIGGGG